MTDAYGAARLCEHVPDGAGFVAGAGTADVRLRRVAAAAALDPATSPRPAT
jgi:hypothetical protein